MIYECPELDVQCQTGSKIIIKEISEWTGSVYVHKTTQVSECCSQTMPLTEQVPRKQFIKQKLNVYN